MRVLQFDVRGQVLSHLDTETDPIQAGSKGYLQTAFRLDDPWRGLRIAVSFFDSAGHEEATWLEGTICNVPDSVTDGPRFRVQLVGVGEGTKVTTNKVTIKQEVH